MTERKDRIDANTTDIAWLKEGHRKMEEKIDRNHEAIMAKLDKQTEKAEEREEKRKQEDERKDKEHQRETFYIKLALGIILATGIITPFLPSEAKETILAFLPF